MNARQIKKRLKRQIDKLQVDNELMREIIADSPTMQELYDVYTKPLNVAHDHEPLLHLRLKRDIIIDWGMPSDEEYFKDLTINQMSHDIGIALGDYIVFNDEEGTATIDVWVKGKEGL